MRTLLAMVAAAATLLPGAPANAGDDAGRVRFLLSAYDHIPTATDFERAASDPVRVLLAAAEDPSLSEALRHRAIDALGALPDERGRAYLVETLRVAAGERHAPRVLHRVVFALVRSAGESAVSEVAPLLHHADAQTRRTVISALATLDSDAVRALLRTHLSTDPDPTVRSAIRRHTTILHSR